MDVTMRDEIIEAQKEEILLLRSQIALLGEDSMGDSELINDLLSACEAANNGIIKSCIDRDGDWVAIKREALLKIRAAIKKVRDCL